MSINIIIIMGIQDRNTKNSIKSENDPKRKALKSSKNMRLIDWYIVIKLSVPCSEWKSTSEKMSVNSIQKQPPQLTLRLGLIRPIICSLREELIKLSTEVPRQSFLLNFTFLLDTISGLITKTRTKILLLWDLN